MIVIVIILIMITWRPAGAATNPVKRWPDSEQAYPGDSFLRARRAHCAYRRVAPSALLNGAPSARWSYPEKNLPLAVFHSSLASARRLALCAPEGRIAPIGASNRRRVLNRRRVILSRDDDLIPKPQSYRA